METIEWSRKWVEQLLAETVSGWNVYVVELSRGGKASGERLLKRSD